MIFEFVALETTVPDLSDLDGNCVGSVGIVDGPPLETFIALLLTKYED